ncbi:hypothetical protein SERLADRAFT_441144 [Serpula lacrymans var. lacrymans S7.9]|uniref:Uncharacterized protein n=1 Tax=Serpula lacrymans var. lacrymans (strain S7.9) TaxID=578457 RepID=F8P5P1_SERL9|nr:uncharacterized protein SERLADRAFT_441144 [Serpula lacrymans var. lacrymans S7.9]EGO21928.1 hypothetical protein SERLADRAFT_441144 [Serpula lacrymans var. lacrymans S7.9]
MYPLPRFKLGDSNSSLDVAEHLHILDTVIFCSEDDVNLPCAPFPENNIDVERLSDRPKNSDHVIVAPTHTPDTGVRIANTNVKAVVSDLQQVVGQQSVPPLRSIPAPRGPLSKPGSGGYALFDELKWDRSTYTNIQTSLHELCQEHFQITLPYHEQEADARLVFLATARRRFPMLEAYVNTWPARDFATMYLKNTSSQWRRKARIACI